MELWPDVHRIESQFNGNALCMYLLRGASKTILIDSGIRSTPQTAILPYLERIGVAPAEIDCLIITHASADHFGGNAAMREAAPHITIIAHRLDVGSITDLDHHLDENFADAAALGCPWPPEVFALTCDLFSPPMAVNWAVEGGEQVSLGDGWSLTLLHTPGHTPGHLSIWDARHQAVFVGDAVLGKGVTSLAGQLASPPSYFDVDDYLGSIAALEALQPRCLLAAHYPIMRDQEVSDFLSESRGLVGRCENALLAALAEARSLTLCEAITVLEGQVGPPGAVWRLTARAHLDKLVASGRAIISEQKGMTHWTRTRRD
jgi:glyoxylase-like metal-dependent hydrolase (beta-lactamase superfamily II)